MLICQVSAGVFPAVNGECPWLFLEPFVRTVEKKVIHTTDMEYLEGTGGDGMFVVHLSLVLLTAVILSSPKPWGYRGWRRPEPALVRI
jgi:hypothetical protein